MLYNIDNVRRVHGERTVLHIDTLSLERGKVYTLTGPNGAGKTTLLKILAFLDKPTSGEIEFMGEQVRWNDKCLQRIRRKVVLLDQSPIMFTGTVQENVAFGLKIRNVGRQETKKRVQEALDMVGLTKFANYDAQGLSGGENKRVALARALAVEPEVLICDEPSANVDTENQEMILDMLAQTNKKYGTTIVFSTHYLSQGYRLADHALLLQNGSLSDILNENIYRAKIVERDGDNGSCHIAGQLLLQASVKDIPVETSEIKLWVDPATLLFTKSRSGDKGGAVTEENCFSGHLVEVSRHKSLVKLCIDIGVRLVLYTSYEIYREQAPMVGEKLHVTIPQSSIRCDVT